LKALFTGDATALPAALDPDCDDFIAALTAARAAGVRL
jgi:hypothetical protein